MRIGYGKIGRSMPLTLEKCGNLGGDVEMVAVVKEMALRHPENEYILIGRNTGEHPRDVGLPYNVHNPWARWAPILREQKIATGLNHGSLSPDEQLKLREIFNNLTLPTITSLDGIVMWVGQHGTTNVPLPSVNKPGQLTKPQDFSAYYVSFLIDGINAWRDKDPLQRDVIWLNADSRNYLKLRDLAWPSLWPVLGQFNEARKIRHEREGRKTVIERGVFDPKAFDATLMEKNDVQLWESTQRTEYARLEVNGLRPGTPFGNLISYDENHYVRHDFGLFINEARAYVNPKVARRNVMKEWVLPLNPHFIHGTWSPESKREMGLNITPAPWDQYYPRLHSVRCTFTTPSSGSGWATAKPWEAFAAGTVCFFHPEYDTQDHILRDADPTLREWLRVKNPTELRERIESLRDAGGTWKWLVRRQREHFDNAMKELHYMNIIDERLAKLP